MEDNRLGSLWKILEREPDLMIKYCKLIREQEKRRIENISPEKGRIVGNFFYLPHSSVIKNDKTSAN